MDTETYGMIGGVIAGLAALVGVIWRYWHASPAERTKMRGAALERLVEETVVRAEAYLKGASGAERKAWVLRQINDLSPIDIDQALLDKLIEVAVARLKRQQVVAAGPQRWQAAYDTSYKNGDRVMP